MRRSCQLDYSSIYISSKSKIQTLITVTDKNNIDENKKNTPEH